MSWLLPAAGVVLALWVVLFLLSRLLPRGVVREAVLFIPHAVVTVKRLLGDRRVPRRVKVVLAVAGLWALSPIDLIPEFIPFLGGLDDIVVFALAIRFAARHTPPEVLREAWPGEPGLLDRLLGRS